MTKKVLFIINPASGPGRRKELKNALLKEAEILGFDVVYSKKPGHAFSLSSQAAGEYDIVVAVGGDGTVNEVGRGLLHSSTSLGIVPVGSGNGLARFLQIPLKVNRAMEVIRKGSVKSIDVIRINNFYSFNVAGVGFDAYISHQFAHKKKRGPLAYLQLISKEFPKYKSEHYSLTVDGESIEMDAFLISFANSSQYGNNVHIAPGALIDDGLIDVCLIKDFPKFSAPALLFSLLDQSIDKSKYDTILKARKIKIQHPSPLLGHIDGEPVHFGRDADIEILPLSLNVIIPPDDLRETTHLLQPIMEMIPLGI
ncbi:diacylglycerol/lipid kinase family protein [Thermophagus sp. OGC60D27]|uniref:diacylglycerol/lipid kinase family protein n=1 Tax=Thermophagus sp. OGC60D27 TaxID=3458415 RepID=UPI00403839DD